MNKSLLIWLKSNEGKSFSSPRKGAYPVRIIAINEALEKLQIEFVGGSQALPIFFLMFDRTLTYIKANKDRVIRLGAKVKEPFDPDTVEGKLWEKPVPYPIRSPYKASPHVCDILVLAEFAEYKKTINPKSGKTVQGVKYITSPTSIPPSSQKNTVRVTEIADEKESFIKKYKQTIIEWAVENENSIVSGRLSYCWKNKTTLECVRERNEVSKSIIMSRIRNCGSVDLATLDKVIMWGFGREFPMRDPEKALRITKEAFDYLDDGKLKDATKILMSVLQVGVSRASKILGLFDQDNLCIYDSRVGNALQDLKHENKKIVPSPAGRGRSGDPAPNTEAWAENYQRLIWTLEIVRDYLNQKGHMYRLADVEMALFMVGKC